MPSDEETIEAAREMFQLALNRAFEALARGSTMAQFFASDPLPSTMRRVAAADLREVGTFELKSPHPSFYMPLPMRKHWVFEHRTEHAIYCIGWKVKRELDTAGFAELHAMVHQPDDES
jgi:hypothetical protein